MLAFNITLMNTLIFINFSHFCVSGVREMMEELERQGITGPMVGRAYHPNPNHNMMRKSQRSNNLRLRFGKRSVAPFEAPMQMDNMFKVRF